MQIEHAVKVAVERIKSLEDYSLFIALVDTLRFKYRYRYDEICAFFIEYAHILPQEFEEWSYYADEIAA